MTGPVLVSNYRVAPAESERQHDTRYYLQIKNLDEVEIEFLVECHHEADPEGTFNDTGVLYGAVIDVYPTQLGGWGRSRTGDLIIDSAWTSVGAQKSTRVRVRGRSMGSVHLRVPPRRSRGKFTLEPQVDHAVPVLLLASQEDMRRSQRRILSDPDDFIQGYIEGTEGFSSHACPLASGQARNEVEAEGWYLEGFRTVASGAIT